MRFGAATIRPNGWLLIDPAEPFGAQNLPGNETIMKNLRLVLLATTALTAMQFASVPSQAQDLPSQVQDKPIVVAQAPQPGVPLEAALPSGAASWCRHRPAPVPARR